MSESNADPMPSAPPPSVPVPPSGRNALLTELPYVVMLLAAFIGIAAGNFTGQPTILYWQLLAPIYALICILAGWTHSDAGADRVHLIWTQALHWLACVVAMRLLFLPEVRGVINDNATGLSLLTVLALATFLGGLHASTWRIAVVGAVLALAVPAAAWVEQSALLLVAEGVVLFGVGALFLWMRSRATAPR
jgi:hypothetical protein